jgi:hypothetical protein
MAGDYFFTSNAPATEFPYPVAFYVAVNALSGWTRDLIPLMRVMKGCRGRGGRPVGVLDGEPRLESAA